MKTLFVLLCIALVGCGHQVTTAVESDAPVASGASMPTIVIPPGSTYVPATGAPGCNAFFTGNCPRPPVDPQ